MCDNIKKEGKKDMRSSHPSVVECTFKHLSRINGEINKMDTDQLIEKLKYYNLDTDGSDQVRRTRLKNNYRKMKFASLNINISDKSLPYYVVIDFEATCTEANKPDYLHEIIEFPAVLVNSSTQEVEDTFQMYCKPVINPSLSKFCVELTGITQDQVDSSGPFEKVLESFENWLKKHNLTGVKKYAIVTDTPWDMSRYLFQQCRYSNIPYPNWAQKWVNLKRAFSNFYKCRQQPLKSMLDHLGMEFEGRLHCGLDDSKNIARLLIRMIRDGANIRPNEKITNRPRNLKIHSKPENKGDDESLSDKMQTFTIGARFLVIENKELLSTYERVKRQRKIMEAKMDQALRENCRSIEQDEELREILEWIPKEHIRDPKKKIKLKWKKLDQKEL